LPSRDDTNEPEERVGSKAVLLGALHARVRAASNDRSYAVSILEVGSSQSRFIVDDGTLPALCCGAPVFPNTSW
jgi:hypothetical protein